MAKPSTDRKKKSAAPPKSKPARPRWFRIVWLSLVVIALGLLVPVLEVGCV